MKFQKKSIYLDNTLNQSSRFGTKDWIETTEGIARTKVERIAPTLKSKFKLQC